MLARMTLAILRRSSSGVEPYHDAVTRSLRRRSGTSAQSCGPNLEQRRRVGFNVDLKRDQCLASDLRRDSRGSMTLIRVNHH